MRKGFTLIELLAVMIVLSIIMVIALPILINVVDDAEKSSLSINAKMYLRAVNQAISLSQLNDIEVLAGTYNITKDGDVCLENYDSINKTCPEQNLLKVEASGEKPSSGTIIVESGKVKNVFIDIDGIDYTMSGNDGISPICTIAKDSEKEERENGAKYICEVKPGVKYNFYVLGENADGTYNLILDRNVYYNSDTDTGLISSDSNKKGLVKWYSIASSQFGPVTAMDYLHNATKDWINIPNMEMNYTDEGDNYGSIITTNYITKITKKDGTVTNGEGYFNLKARLPYFNEVNGKCTNANGSCPLYLVNYLNKDNNGNYSITNGKVEISGVYGYLTLSSTVYVNDTAYAYIVHYMGYVNYYHIGYLHHGVRPVITLKI